MKSACVIDDHDPSRIHLVGVLRKSGAIMIAQPSSRLPALASWFTSLSRSAPTNWGQRFELAIARFQEFVALRKENKDLKKNLDAGKIIERAKGILMNTQRLTEAEAFAAMKRKSMDNRKPMVEIAQAMLLAEEIAKGA